MRGRRVEFQSVCRVVGGRARDRAVHPGTAAGYGLRNPFDADAAIDAQAHLMHDLLRRFGSVPLALAAYNAGEKAVARCGCIPPYAETRAYVAKILGLLTGAGAVATAGLEVRLVR